MSRFFLIILSLIPLDVGAQPKQGQVRLDSLLTILPNIPEDSNGVKLLHAISAEYYFINPDEGLRFGQKELELARKIGWKKGFGMAYDDIGGNYLKKSELPIAFDYCFKALSIAQEAKDDETVVSAASNIGNVYAIQRNIAKAIAYKKLAAHVAEQTGNKRYLGISYGLRAGIYSLQKDFKTAVAYRLKAIRIAEELDDKARVMAQTQAAGATYSALKNLPIALAFSHQALQMAEQLGYKESIALNLGNIGTNYLELSRSTGRTNPDIFISSDKKVNLARAINYLRQSIEACREGGYKNFLVEKYQNLSEAYALSGRYKEALESHLECTALKDSIFSTDNANKISGIETRRIVELKDKDLQVSKLALANKRYERILYIGGLTLLLCLMAILYRNNTRQKKSNVLLKKEKARSDDLLLNILPAEVADELKEKGAAEAKQYDNVSVLFTDFVNFTGSSEQLGAKAMVKELNECFTAFDKIIERNGLEKIKTIGDAYMAVCGLPIEDPLHAIKTVQAALEIRDFIANRNHQTGFAIRIGINSGPVVAGIVGVKKFAYDIWGDTVNTAARMEQSGQAGQVNISQSTYELVKNKYRCAYRGKLAAKNKGEVEMYFVEEMVREGVEYQSNS